MIYGLPPLDEPVDQGDLINHCPVAFVAGFDPAYLDAVELGCERRRVVVMTQSGQSKDLDSHRGGDP